MRNILKLLVFIPLLTACDDFFSPAPENNRSIDAMYKEPSYAQGFLGTAYDLLPYQSDPNSDVATDDAVTNDLSSAYLKMATGSWTSSNDPMSRWNGANMAIQYLNIFIQNCDKVAWAKDSKVSTMYKDRLKGEAYGLRALEMFSLLRAHGGWTADGKLLGVPIDTIPQTATSDFNQPRNTFAECIQQINKDIASALSLLPLDFGDIADADIPAKYKALGVTSAGDYNRVNGAIMRGRITGRIVEAIKAQVALFAASPAYSAGSGVTWANAADNAAAVLDRINGVSGLAAKGGTWYANTSEIDNLASGSTPPEIIWRSDVSSNYDFETNNFPPSLFGKGRVNPTQNLVDAFPALNGYPISDPNSNYVATTPYTNRDPRLAKYVIFNGDVQGPKNSVIVTGTYNTTNNDAINKQSGASTRTGYYLRKLTRYDCNPDPNSKTGQKHYSARIRYTEIFLAYAEAANEAFGPLGKGSHNYSAYDVIKAIRARAGVGVSNGDAYLESIKADKDKMRQLIQNERRLELCFENQRFYDLRRWKVSLSNLNATAHGVQIDKQSDGKLQYTPLDVETRSYKDYMYFGPIPYGEMLKWNKLQQNAGW
ncbi:RagB/SusD family nutrient uptake outer membrane protein [Paludibacter sp.]|uniref:RagB/SusD family nutrient uptake outer membrane protein n=1 Tax=Paludibacter sp. TaxID=1898105 RepID=UPI001352448E|nr:RagB/SusD family nutrient uptake outer membrane protein [Paludibacter sp.]MTK54497.1 RagB/SusD family nutrient uptake outer membrane protein [Paludibacter sp.]